ncbi:MAG TPA: hypothetical protein VMS43_07175 [Allosphingosinicella sp.]|nr:hypothetical protein [Allosphingosinicella sp.]
MSVRSLALVAVAAFVALGTMTFAVSPVFARECGDVALASAGGVRAAPIFSVSLAVD